jgi:hypothetical protein
MRTVVWHCTGKSGQNATYSGRPEGVTPPRGEQVVIPATWAGGSLGMEGSLWTMQSHGALRFVTATDSVAGPRSKVAKGEMLHAITRTVLLSVVC